MALPLGLKPSTSNTFYVAVFACLAGFAMGVIIIAAASSGQVDWAAECKKEGGIYIAPKYAQFCLKPEAVIWVK